MADRAAADVRLGDLRDRERRLHAGHRPLPLERILQREPVQERREHAGVVGRRPLHSLRRRRKAAVEVAPADDDRDFDAVGMHIRDLAGELSDDADVDAVLAVAHQRLSRQLQQNALEAGLLGGARLLASGGAHLPDSANSSNSSTSAPASCSAWPTDFEESWIHSWSTSTLAPKKRLFSMPSTIFSRACSGFDCTSSELW